MAYDKQSFLSGLAAGRNMESWPTFEASEGSWFTWQIDMSYLNTLDYYVWLNPTYIPGSSVTVDWGDGNVESFTTPVHSEQYYHTYDSARIYRIIVYGIYSCALDLFATSGVRESVISIDAPITFPDESNVERRHAYSLSLDGFTHLKSVAHGILRNVSRCGFLFGGATFTRCLELEAIPEDLLDYINPELLADYAQGPTLCKFTSCRAITEIPKKLFSRNDLWSQVLGIQMMFAGCDSLRSVPKGLFSALVNCTDFEACFLQCDLLESVEDDVFKGCAAATTFERAFMDCPQLREIGSGVFSGCSSVTTFYQCFENCHNLSHVPSDLFSDCDNVADMSRCFCESGIQEIPSGLFDSFTNVTLYSSCFYYCTSLATVPSGLFDSNAETDVNFSSCFNGDDAIISSVPELWVKYPNTSYAHRYHCFTGCTSAANYADIPDQYTPFPPGGWR